MMACFLQEPFENGPLFSELSYYRRAAKEEASKPPRKFVLFVSMIIFCCS